MKRVMSMMAMALTSTLAIGCSASMSGEAPMHTGAATANEGGENTMNTSPQGGAVAPPTSPPPSIDPETATDDRYEAVGTNAFVLAASDPMSTFAADVDTASYDIFRRDVAEFQRLPHPDSVRLEEFVNAFSYAYDAPEWGEEHPFAINLEAAASPFAESNLVQVGIQGLTIPDSEKKPGNLVFLVDVSGSMTGANKLSLVKVVLEETLAALAPTDLVSIVTYASEEEVRLAPTPVSHAETILAVINGLSAGGSTAGAAGIQMAYEQAESAYIEGGINHVILCTDGDFNVGISDDDELVAFIEDKRESGVTLTALGFGSGNLNDAMMEKVSNAGNGFYSVVATEDQAIAYAHTKLLNTTNLIAKDVKIQVQFNPDHVLAYRLLGYENRAIADEDFTNDAVDAGEVGSGHSVTALYEVVLTGEAIPAPEGARIRISTVNGLGDDVGGAYNPIAVA
ncbi:MAG: von Willebrand factor type A domain-containing protein, partial [Myxococcota bacterium]|nr:von Willebrand factor type A domain-containing protein [Myxococcota bacterium]